MKIFINNIVECFPEYQETLIEYYSKLLEIDTSNDDKHVKRFMRKTLEYSSLISKRDSSIFNNNIYL